MARPRRRCSQDPCNPYYRRTLVSSVRSRRRETATGQHAGCHVSRSRASPPAFTPGAREFEAGFDAHSLTSFRHPACTRPRRPVGTAPSHSNPPLKKTPVFHSSSGSSESPSKKPLPGLLQRLLDLLDSKAPTAQDRTSELLALTNPSRPEKLTVFPAGIGSQRPYDFEDSQDTDDAPKCNPLYPNLPVGDSDDSIPMLGDNLQDLATSDRPPRYSSFFHPRCGRLLLNLDEMGQRDDHGNRIYLYQYIPADRQDDAYWTTGPAVNRAGSPVPAPYGSRSLSPRCDRSPNSPAVDDRHDTPVYDLPWVRSRRNSLDIKTSGKAVKEAQEVKDPLEKIGPMSFHDPTNVYSVFLRSVRQHAHPVRTRRRTASEPEPGRVPFPDFDPILVPQTSNFPEFVYPMTGLPTLRWQGIPRRLRSLADIPERG
ncbi:hypothetical protein IWX90DRAFT_143654 [Phyllosticta citrichinensis]|uniref:Uncharacterized protein n=1 Tax=Phyllosticta citrichinensis TaxID=1130410 RepID=A0ABR1XZ97_9PEZI